MRLWVTVYAILSAACLPVTSMPPPLPGAASNGDREAGAALVAGTGNNPYYAGLETWFVWDKEIDFGLLAGVSTNDGFPYGGGMIRFPIKETDKRYLGIQTTAVAFIGASVSVPISFALRDRVWLYTGPTLAFDGWGSNVFPYGLIAKVPMGLALENRSSLRILQEVGVQSFPTNFPTVYYSIGLSKPWSK